MAMNPKSKYRDIAVPSLFILIFQSRAILWAYSRLEGCGTGRIAPIGLMALSIIILPLIYNNSIRIEYSTLKQNKKKLLLLLAATLLISISSTLKIKNPGAEPLQENLTTYSGIIEKKIFRRYNYEVIIKLNDTLASAQIPLEENFQTGDMIDIHKKPVNINSTNSNSSYDRYLLRKGISLKFYIKKKDFKITPGISSNTINWIKENLSRNIESLFSEKNAGILKALYFGNKNYIDKKTIENYRNSGVIHILAASGLHTGIIASMVFAIFAFVRLDRRLIYIMAMILLIFYLYITDMPSSLMRASIMFAVFALQYIFHLTKNMFNALFTAAIIILIISPSEIYNPGFHLSSGATLSILLFFRAYKNSLFFLPPFLSVPLSLGMSAQPIT